MICEALYRRLRAGLISLSIVGVASFATVGAQVTTAARLITGTVNNSDRVELTGGVSRAIAHAQDLGAANPSLSAGYVHIVLQRSTERQAVLDGYLADLQNPRSKDYHHWLTPSEYGTRFGVSSDDLQAVSAWLQSQGLQVKGISPAGNIITVSGTIGELQSAFSVHIHSLLVNNETHLANIDAPKVPTALAPAVKSISGLDDFRPKSHLQKGTAGKFNAANHRIEPDFTIFRFGLGTLFMDPADAATVYDTPNANLNPNYSGTTYDGTGVKVGIVGDSNVDLEPVTNYRLGFLGETVDNINLPSVVIDGNDPGINGDELEAWLDLEVLGGVAPKAKLNYYISQNTDISSGLLDAMQRAVNDNAVSVLSVSYGACESLIGTAANQYFSELWGQAAAQGITVVVSSGDSGAANCDSDASTIALGGLAVSGIASTPYNVAVGGTDFDTLATDFSDYVDDSSSGKPPYWGTAKKFIPEATWNDSTSVNGSLAQNAPLYLNGFTDIVGGGGGMSSIYSKPTFQGALTPNDNARDVPDVSFLAGNGLYGALWVICEQDYIHGADCLTENGTFNDQATFHGAGGTSAATPAFAGMLALVVQATGSRLGQANNVLYNLASTKYSSVFHDVTAGNNSVFCDPNASDCGANGFTNGYDAGTGYDLASGLGSVDAASMLANWSSGEGETSQTTLTINGANAPVSVVHGTSLQFAVAVDPGSSTGNVALVDGASNTTVASLAPIPVTAGAGSASYNGLPGGQHTIYANFSGGSNTAASRSNPVSVSIAPETSSTKTWINAYSVPDGNAYGDLTTLPYGSSIFVEATVFGKAEGVDASLGVATGTMAILDNGQSIGAAPILAGNLASFPAVAQGGVYPIAHPYAVGTHRITETFPGDLSYKSNTSNEVDFTVIQGPTIASIYPATLTPSSTSTDKVEVDIDTSSFANPPTGMITLSANGKTLASTSNLTLTYRAETSTALATAVLVVDGSQLAIGANTITATYSGDNNYVASSNTLILTNAQSTFSLKAGSLDVTAGSTTGNTAVVTVAPTGTFAGPVSLACSVTGAPANAVSPVTCSVPSSVVVTGIGNVTAALTITSSSSTATGIYSVTVTGKDASGAINSSATSTVTVEASPSVPAITLANSGNISIIAGAGSGNTSSLTITPVNEFTGVVNLSCAVTSSPAAASAPVTCGMSPASIDITGATVGSSTITIQSTSRGTMASLWHPNSSGAGGTLLACLMLFWLPKRRRLAVRLLALLPMVLLAGALSGCSGSSAGTGSTPSQPGTTAGTYVVVVTANPADAEAKTSTVTVTVN